MNSDHSDAPPANLSREQRMSLMFANMVIQQTNMALIFLGKVPNPETGQTVQDLNTAQIFIDQLEMLEAKTKGNLDKREESLLSQSLTELRMAFVDAVGSKSAAPASKPSEPQAPPASQPAATPEATPSSNSQASAEAAETAPSEQESRKRFTKKY